HIWERESSTEPWRRGRGSTSPGGRAVELYSCSGSIPAASTALRTISSRPNSAFQLSSAWMRETSATRAGGSPARRSPISGTLSRPVTSAMVAMTSLTGRPGPVPQLNSDRGVGELGPTGAGDVEVAQLDGVERLPVHLRCGALVVDHPLADELGLAIGIDRAGFEVLADHVDVGHPIGRSRGGEDERFDPG